MCGKEIIETKNAPGAIGPYSQAVGYAGLVFVSGQLPIEPKTGEIAAGIEAQTRQVLENVKGVLEAAGSSTEKVLKTTIYLKDMSQFGQVNAIYGEYFQDKAPARACIEVARLPKDVEIEMEAIAAK